MRLVGLEQPLHAIDLVQDLLEPQLVDLVNDDEEQLVVLGPVGARAAAEIEQLVDMEVDAVGNRGIHGDSDYIGRLGVRIAVRSRACASRAQNRSRGLGCGPAALRLVAGIQTRSPLSESIRNHPTRRSSAGSSASRSGEQSSPCNESPERSRSSPRCAKHAAEKKAGGAGAAHSRQQTPPQESSSLRSVGRSGSCSLVQRALAPVAPAEPAHLRTRMSYQRNRNPSRAVHGARIARRLQVAQARRAADRFRRVAVGDVEQVEEQPGARCDR